MFDPVRMLVDGGPFMYVLLLLGLLGTPCAVLFTLFVGAVQRRIPASSGWGLLTLAAPIGLYATWSGMQLASQAAGAASEEIRLPLMAAGAAVALYTSFAGLAVTGLGLVAVAACAWLPLLGAPGPDASADKGGIVGAIGGGLVGTLACGGLVLGMVGLQGITEAGPVAMLGLPVLALITLGAATLASLRVSPSQPQRARVAASRVMLGTAALLGVGLIGESGVVLGEMQAFQAVAYAVPEQRGQLLGMGQQVAAYSRWMGWGLALPAALAAWGSAAPHLSQLDRTSALGAVIAGVQVLIVLGCVAAGAAIRDVSIVLQ